MSDELEDAMSEALGRVRRDVEAAVRIPPYELVLRRHRRRRRRAAGAGGVALAALVAAGFAITPALTSHRTTSVTPATDVRVSLAPPQGAGTLSLSDVSFADAAQGALLGRRCTATCHDVVSASSDGGQHYGAEVTVPGGHRYVAVVGDGMELAYAPDLAVSSDRGATWTALGVPAPVADVSVSGGTVLVLLTPAGAPAQLWSGPLDATSWAGYTDLGAVTGSDDTARLLRPATSSLVVVSSGSGAPRVASATLGPAAPRWRSSPLALCGAGALPSVSAVSATTWWVACEGQQDPDGAETVAVTTDAGETYTSGAPPAAGGTQQQVTALSPGVAYLSGGPALLVTTDGGRMWSVALKEPGLATPHVPAGVGGQDIWVVQPGAATVWRTTGGGTWTGLRLR